MINKSKGISYYGLGRRKSSTARVNVKPGTGKFIINKREAKQYLMSDILVMDANQPYVLTENMSKFDTIVNVKGGGLSGQAGAIRLGIARALLDVTDSHREVLKKAGMLTRDARATERKKPGLKKARKARQFSKR